ncbi:hypothetical protein [Roseomonas haemaphysalidis]|uniref:Phasin family protein n=1 Tax=Roseomonas haemaphysalidis TaxID=2768162 RepID=A0ABS3KPM9_9PROT|nr:hypothetical protein [Roseomonas haemaphysalidis]MBO1079432.1 hypothetical protein [Roseomonas haemaphysalidis]
MSKPAKPAPARPAADPAQAALRRFSDLIARGFDAARLQREAAAVISDWAGELQADSMRERLDSVHDQLAEGVDAAQDMGCEIEPGDAASAKLHQRSIGALIAARDAFGQAARRL